MAVRGRAWPCVAVRGTRGRGPAVRARGGTAELTLSIPPLHSAPLHAPPPLQPCPLLSLPCSSFPCPSAANPSISFLLHAPPLHPSAPPPSLTVLLLHHLHPPYHALLSPFHAPCSAPRRHHPSTPPPHPPHPPPSTRPCLARDLTMRLFPTHYTPRSHRACSVSICCFATTSLGRNQQFVSETT